MNYSIEIKEVQRELKVAKRANNKKEQKRLSLELRELFTLKRLAHQ